jgi:hypothetical protein
MQIHRIYLVDLFDVLSKNKGVEKQEKAKELLSIIFY